MAIIDKSNIKEFYKLVKHKLDDYLTFNVNPNKLKLYMEKEKNMNRFISKSDFGDITNIKKVIMDVLEDMCVRKIMKFESYINLDIKNNLSDIYNFDNIELFEYEKVLSDYIRLSLSKVSIENNEKRILTINGNKFIVLSESDVDNIIKKISDILSKSIGNLKYKFNDIDLEVKRNQDISIVITENNNINNILKRTIDIEYNTQCNIIEYKNYKIIKIN